MLTRALARRMAAASTLAVASFGVLAAPAHAAPAPSAALHRSSDPTAATISAMANVASVDETLSAAVTVSAPDHVPTGTVEILGRDGTVRGSATLDGEGSARVPIASFPTAGERTLNVRYLGDDATEPASTTLRYYVVKKSENLYVHGPKRIARNSHPTARVHFNPARHVTGLVRLRVRHAVLTHRLVDGATTFRLPRTHALGKYQFEVIYLGSRTVGRAIEYGNSRVVRSRR